MLNKVGRPVVVFHCADHEHALDFLYRRGTCEDQSNLPRPAIILLDLELPGTGGLGVLAVLKSDDHLKTIPVIILSNSDDERDVLECYRAGANSYVQKPPDGTSFIRRIGQVKEYWLETVRVATTE